MQLSPVSSRLQSIPMQAIICRAEVFCLRLQLTVCSAANPEGHVPVKSDPFLGPRWVPVAGPVGWILPVAYDICGSPHCLGPLAQEEAQGWGGKRHWGAQPPSEITTHLASPSPPEQAHHPVKIVVWWWWWWW